MFTDGASTQRNVTPSTRRSSVINISPLSNTAIYSSSQEKNTMKETIERVENKSWTSLMRKIYRRKWNKNLNKNKSSSGVKEIRSLAKLKFIGIWNSDIDKIVINRTSI